jgi:phage nucleotide-binding protein
MALSLTTAAELSNAPPIAVVYAAPGMGKTTLLTSLIKPGLENETLVIDADEGARVITNIRPNAHIARIDSFEDLEDLFHKVKTGHADWAGYKNIAIDTLTKMEQILLWDILRKKQKTVPTIDNYGERSARMAETIHDWRSLKRNVFFICHEQEIDIKEETPYGEEVVITRKVPMLSGKMSQVLCAEVDLVLRLGFKQVTDRVTNETKSFRVLQTFKTDTVHAKDRSGNLERFEIADLRLVLKKWYTQPTDREERTEVSVA